MALPSSGAISFSQVNVELSKASTATISLNDAAVRALFGKASGAISMSDGHGKSNSLTYTISTAQSNANLRTLCNNLGYAGTVTNVIVDINAQISSTSTSTPALEIGSWPAGVTLEINVNKMIVGKGGAGGTAAARAGLPGGPALKASSAISSGSIKVIINSGGSVRGGGGGGGAGADSKIVAATYYGGAGGNGAGPGAATAGAAGGGSGLAGAGGNGGTYGAAGAKGGAGNGTSSPGVGGAAGPAVQGSANFSRVGWTSGSTYFGAIT